ncbi:MAG: YfcC family protein [Clostridium sp.]
METQSSMKKRKLSFPTAFTVLFIVLILSAILTFIIPAGSYVKLSYDSDKSIFTTLNPSGEITELPATQQTLDKLNVKATLDKFTDGSITKPIAIPGTYEKITQNPQGLKEIITSPIEGVYDTIDIIMFVFIIGGVIGVLNFSGAFNAGIASLSRITKGKEYMLIVFVTFLIALGGTTFGLAEETIALYPILVPIFLAAKYDVLVCIAAIYMGTSVGTMFSTVNPFSAVIASNAAGINFTDGLGFRAIALIIALAITLIYILKYAKKVKNDPSKSLVYDLKDHIEEKFASHGEAPKLTLKLKLMLIIFASTFAIMIYGVSSQGWWFTEMTALFLVSGIIIGVLSGMGEKQFVNKFVAGAGDLISVALVIGVARSINIVLENGGIADSILNFCSTSISGMNSNIFIILMLIVFIVLGFFIPSSSGLAVLSIPIMAPLADSVGLPREVIISSYLYGIGLIAFITPTGLILATLSMVDVTYDKWLKFIMPLMGYLAIFSAIMLLIQVNL